MECSDNFMNRSRIFSLLLVNPFRNLWHFRGIRSRAMKIAYPPKEDSDNYDHQLELPSLGLKASSSLNAIEDNDGLDEMTQALENLRGVEKYKVKNAMKKARKRILQLNFDHIPLQDRIVLMFPGQGTQHLKMGAKVIDNPESARLFEEANEFLKFDLLDLCLNGPKTKLDQIYYSQLAIFVSSLAALAKLKVEQPDFQDRLTDCAGFDIGEMNALVAAEVLTFSEALEIVNLRANAVSECCQLASSGMVTIRTCAASDLNSALKEARDYSREQGEPPICDVANYLFCHVKTVAGANKALEHFTKHAHHFKIQILKRLPIYGALHTRMMYDAAVKVEQLLHAGHIQLRIPRVNVYSNYTGKCHTRHLPSMARDIARQISNPVKWEQIMQILFNKRNGDIFPSYIEISSSRDLGNILYQIGKKTSSTYLNYPI